MPHQPYPRKGTVRRPKYILNIDDLPKVVEADEVVYPIFMSIRNAARAFGLPPQTVLTWIKRYDLPVLMDATISPPRAYISVSDLTDWIAANTRLFRETDELAMDDDEPDDADESDTGGDLPSD
ncbi:MAG: hypothetical protein M3O41_00395 [Pseudomonadota bacterium]|nr:hypothetical protein [Pseudomonadota bacterium]